ncbi:sarcocystatin-A-like [Drosophila subpulchrella]|uniref:sarcocystatin-A-like n=1 Tax=Drosophila subpulchrella TaxID=1486046 RepID=UPI0018A15626|nr:sarcocystatin-A-like [Drosophila subpulchrella]
MFLAKILILCSACLLISATPQGFGGFGAPKTLQGEELVSAQRVLQASLTKLAAGEGPHYRISKIRSASTQVVAGSKHIYSVELIDNEGAIKVCNVDIWSRSWLPNGIQVTFRCPNEPELVRQHSA